MTMPSKDHTVAKGSHLVMYYMNAANADTLRLLTYDSQRRPVINSLQPVESDGGWLPAHRRSTT